MKANEYARDFVLSVDHEADVLEQRILEEAKRFPEVSFAKLSRIAKHFYDFGKEQMEKQGGQKELNLVETLKHYPRETELYSPLYGKLWLAEVDEEHGIITCYKYQLENKCTRAVLEQEDTVSFYSNGTTGLPDFSVSKDCMLFLYDSKKQKEQKPSMIQWTGDNLKEVVDFTGKSPRFEEWWKSWDELENYVHSHNDIFKLFCEDGSHYEVPVGAWIVKTPDGYNVPSQSRFIQKPAEWSEEDESMLKIIVDLIYGGTHCAYEREVNWLKSLKYRFSGQPQLTEFEKALSTICENLSNGIDKVGDIKVLAKNLLEIAKKELEK